MTTLSYTVPVAGSTLNSIADPEIATALSAILAWANGNVDGTNIAAASITAANLRSVFPSGLLAARPAAGAAGETFYYATDSGLLYWSNGTAWTTVSSPTGVGAWQPLTLAGGISALSGAYAPAARLEGTDVVRLRGTIQQTSGSFPSGTTIFTIPNALRQTQASVGLQLTVSYGTGPVVGTMLQASVSGNCTLNATFTGLMFLDGLTYSL